MQKSSYIGIKPGISTKLDSGSTPNLINDLIQTGYDYVLTSITNNKYRESSKKFFQQARTSNQLLNVPGPTLHQVNLFEGQYLNNTIGLLSSWIELENDDEQISGFSKQVLINEIQYAKFIGLKHIIIAPPKDLIKLSNYSKVLKDALVLTKSHNIIISISLPICENISSGNVNSIDYFSTWDMWNSIRINCDYDLRLKISLAIPKNQIPLSVIERWFCEPVSCLLISSSIFLINNKGYPVLSKQNQILLNHFKVKNPIYLLHGLEKTADLADHSTYLQYINYLIIKNEKLPSKLENFSKDHNDILLPPLQPLKNNLDNFTYDVFQTDTVKYDLYSKAISKALLNFSTRFSKINIAVVGAGKGGLVDVTFKLIQELNIKSKCKLTIIEKNSNACIYLNSKNLEDWKNSTEILNIDMRKWNPEEKYHLVISELLGSFGCNELAPECLKHLEKYLDPNGTFIPQSYSSFISPIFAPKLYERLKHNNDNKSFEKQYVVKLLEYCSCSSKVNEVWKFDHPSINDNFNRNTISVFKIKSKTMIHGFAGYFTAKLYDDIVISIKPDNHTNDLISWFPIFFPIESPLYVTDDTELEISISREKKDGRVWYSWSLETFIYLLIPGSNSNEVQVRVRTGITKIHNHNGEAFHIDEAINN